MEYMTTTELRTHSSKLVHALEKGNEVKLIHRSKVIAMIRPQEEEEKSVDIKKLADFLDSIKPKKILSKKEQGENYRKHLIKKYGKNLL